jgi:ankyrin repeat protein
VTCFAAAAENQNHYFLEKCAKLFSSQPTLREKLSKIVNLRGRQGQTAYYRAAVKGPLLSLQYLFDLGADPTITSDPGAL